MSNADTNQEVVQAIVDAVMLAVNSKLSEYDKSVSAKLRNWKINGDQIVAGTVPGVALANGAVSNRALAEDAGTSEEVVNELVQKSFQNVKIDVSQVNNFNANVADIANANIKTANIDLAQINSISAGGIFTADLLADGKVLISNLVVSEAMIADLFAGNLIIRGEDGNMYAIKVDEDGTIKTEAKYITNAEITDGTVNGAKIKDNTLDGRKIIEESITSNLIAADQILATHIKANEITGDKLAAHTITAGQIAAGTISTNEITSDFGEVLDLSSNETIVLRVKNIQTTAPTTPKSGELWLDTSGTEPVLKCWNGTEWVDTADLTAVESKIESIRETTDANIQILQDGINTTVSNITESVSVMQNELTGGLQTATNMIAEQATQLQQTKTDFTLLVSDTQKNIDSLNDELKTYQTYMRLDNESGLTISKVEDGKESPFKITIDDQQMSFWQNGAVVAYVSNDKLFIKNAEITDKQTIGNYYWQKFADGSIGLLVSD